MLRDMPRFMRHRKRLETSAEPSTAEADLIEQDILEDERRRVAEEIRISRKWARRMGPLFWLGLTATLVLFAIFAEVP